MFFDQFFPNTAANMEGEGVIPRFHYTTFGFQAKATIDC